MPATTNYPPPGCQAVFVYYVPVGSNPVNFLPPNVTNPTHLRHQTIPMKAIQPILPNPILRPIQNQSSGVTLPPMKSIQIQNSPQRLSKNTFQLTHTKPLYPPPTTFSTPQNVSTTYAVGPYTPFKNPRPPQIVQTNFLGVRPGTFQQPLTRDTRLPSASSIVRYNPTIRSLLTTNKDPQVSRRKEIEQKNVKKRRRRRQATPAKDAEPTRTTCHQCKLKTKTAKMRCSQCIDMTRSTTAGVYCKRCLKNRYGEEFKTKKDEAGWVCPVCRGICNCAACVKAKKRGKGRYANTSRGKSRVGRSVPLLAKRKRGVVIQNNAYEKPTKKRKLD